jgi:hypothetical protein
VSISPTVYEQPFCTKSIPAAFELEVWHFDFWRKKIDGKAAVTMLVKLSTGFANPARLIRDDNSIRHATKLFSTVKAFLFEMLLLLLLLFGIY